MALSEEQIAKLIAISPDIMSEDSPGGTTITGDEMVSALGLEGNVDAVPTEIDKWYAYWVEHDDLKSMVDFSDNYGMPIKSNRTTWNAAMPIYVNYSRNRPSMGLY